MQYLLLPFTHSIDREAIDQALVMAENLSACLVCVAFIPCSPDKHKGIRLERIQQAKDFLEYMYYRARQTGVTLQRMELYVPNLEESILRLSQEMDNAPILLFTRHERGILLDLSTIRNVIEDERSRYYLLLLAQHHGSIALPQFLQPLLQKYQGTAKAPALRFLGPHRADPESMLLGSHRLLDIRNGSQPFLRSNF
ncbi:hypothetical protein [Ktedonobacter robiniae]|uniref:UspA domain-containing protein n=1 Tax=Ktedonobacter robiniae TaxID=2778365 RepID=A0ABQ3UGC8_9CHLR|nr:hypothetical protein [Ktedonobacter robiniae]GHO51665.1 hypothetical protein KSB_01400 [Ktedonobacter robiniae]